MKFGTLGRRNDGTQWCSMLILRRAKVCYMDTMRIVGSIQNIESIPLILNFHTLNHFPNCPHEVKTFTLGSIDLNFAEDKHIPQQLLSIENKALNLSSFHISILQHHHSFLRYLIQAPIISVGSLADWLSWPWKLLLTLCRTEGLSSLNSNSEI